MQEIDQTANPFPGLRPFESSETHLFFGRDGQSEELLRRLKRTRFLAVVGTSGSGKSSLVRAGLLPALQGGLMASAGSDWRIAILRPGNDPIGNLARALASPKVLGSRGEKDADMQAVMAETTLRRSSLGLVELVSRARTKVNKERQPLFHDYENLLVVVDQFEELFRFKQLIEEENSAEDAAAFVKLLLEAVGQQTEKKIYIVLTMRSDFLGDCSQFFELPEAINNGQYLIPRMTRDERREAISGPVAVGRGSISDPLVNQLLNDVGDNPDQLPILQHALMRTWDHWLAHRRNGNPIDIPDYNAIGGMAEALSRHADEAYAELNDTQKFIAEKLFKGLTEKGTDNREIRRPMEVQEICELTGADEAAVIAVVEVFRREGRSFLMPPPTDALTGKPVHLNRESLIDISHESLIRNWTRLRTWVDDESRSARIYRRLAETAVLHKEGGAGLWRDPDLGVALTWREQSNPNHVWARRYHSEFPLAMSFLDESVTARDAQTAREEASRRREIKRSRITALIFAVAFLFSLAMGVYAYGKKNVAQSALVDAKTQQTIAEEANARTAQALSEANVERDKAKSAQNDANAQKDLAVVARTEADKRAEEARTSAQEAEKQRRVAEIARIEAKRNELYASKREGEAIDAAKEAIKQIGENRRLLYSSNIGVAQKRIEDNNTERAQKLLSDLVYDPSKARQFEVSDMVLSEDTEDLRGFEWYYLWRLASRKLATFKLGEGASTQADTRPPISYDEGPVAFYTARPVAPIALGAMFHEQLVAAGNDNIVRVWFGLSGNPEISLPAQKEAVKAVAALGLYQFITADRTAVKVWSLPSPDPDAKENQDAAPRITGTAKLKGNDAHIVLDVLEDKNVVAIGNGSTFMLWHTRGKEPITLSDGGDGYPSVKFVENGEALITSDGRNLMRWNVQTNKGSEIRLLGKDNQPVIVFIQSLAFTRDARTMVTSSEGSFMVWTAENADATTYSLKTELPAHRENYFDRVPFQDLVVAISPDGKLLATGDGTDLVNGGGVKLWDITGDQPKELFTLSPDVAYATSLDFSSNSRTLAVGAGGVVQLWNVGEKEPWQSPTIYALGQLPATIKQAPLESSAISPDGQLEAVSSGPYKVKWWNPNSDPSSIPTPTLVGTVSTKAIAFSHDGKLLAVGGGGDEASNGVVTLWDVQTRKQIEANIDGHKGVEISVTSFAFSPDNKILATGGTDKTIELWDISTGVGRLLTTPLEGHKSTVTSLAYSPDGKTIASGDESGMLNLWSATSYQLLLTLKASSDSITAVAFSADGDILYSRDKIGEVRSWPATPREQVNRLLQQASTAAPPSNLFHRRQVAANESKYSFLSKPLAKLLIGTSYLE